MRRFLVVCLPLVLAPALAAQQNAATSQVHGRLVDSISGQPVLRGWVCQYQPASGSTVRCGETDSLGAFVVEGLPAGSANFFIVCRTESRTDLGTVNLVDDIQVSASESGTDLGRIVVDARKCDQRPITVRSGEFVGFYSRGWESSRFKWVGDTTLSIWVSGRLSDTGERIWPTSLREHGHCIQVRWFGELTGPGRYGHLGAADYEFVVDSVAEARSLAQSEC